MKLDRAKEIILKAKKSVFTGNIGNNLTAFKGDGLDFAEIRNYNSGDDIKKINWKATAKTGELKLNEFHEERELHIVVVAMLSGSLLFGTKRLKNEVMAELLALIGFSAINNGDRFESIIFSNKLERHFKPSKRVGQVEGAVEELLSINPIGKEANFSELATFLQAKLKKKAIVIILSDFYEEIDLILLSRHQLYTIAVRDHFEEEPNLSGELELIDPISQKEMELNINSNIIKKYKNAIKNLDNKLKEQALEYGATYGKIYCNDELYIRALQIFKG